MTTLEKLCRTACEAEGIDPDESLVAYGRYDNGRAWELHRPTVLAVLTALEDLSDEMVRAGLEAPDSGWTDVELKGRFTAMIRKAKKG